MRVLKSQPEVEIFSLRLVRIRCRDPEKKPWLNPSSRFTSLETQVERRSVANLSPIRSDLAQSLEQLGFDTGGDLRGKLDRARGPSQDDTPLEPAEVIEEPRTACERGLRRAHHLEEQHQAVAAALIANFM